MPGMMSEHDMAVLDAATGGAFDKLWLIQMTRHHQGAVAMAKTELANGQNPDAKARRRLQPDCTVAPAGSWLVADLAALTGDA